MNIASSSHNPPSQLLPLNLPCQDLLNNIAVDMVTNHPELAINWKLLGILAQTFPPSFNDKKPLIILRVINSVCAIFHTTVKFPNKESDAMKLLRIILKEIMKLPKAEFDDIMRGPPDETKEDEKQTTISENVAKAKYSSRVLFLAVEYDNTEFVGEVIRQCPHLALEVNDNNQSIFHVAVSRHREGIFKLLIKNKHIMNMIVTLEDEYGNNMFHLVTDAKKFHGILGLTLNEEFQWYQEVSSIVPSNLRYKKNASGLTPIQLFVNNNKDRFSNEEKCIKETANQLMVVAALVATISFAAIFTFPGGYNQDTGIPIFLRKNLSKIFIIFDSLSFISSTTSVLMVLSIINSDYTFYQLMVSKPKQLGQCVALVFLSIATIILTFLIILFILYERNSIWMPIVISVSAVIPYLMFAFRQYQLRGRKIKFQ